MTRRSGPATDDATRLRSAAIAAAAGDPRHPPAWCFLAHPVMRSLLSLTVPSATLHRPTDPMADDVPWPRPTVQGARLSYVGVKVVRGGVGLRIDAASQIARISILSALPPSIAGGIPGRRLAEVLDLPGMGPGTPAGDSPVRDCIEREDRAVLTVECTFVPLADPPPGIDAAWLA